MDNQPGLISSALIEFGQGGEYKEHAMSEAKESAGFAPLETLPAEWYNNYLFKLDQHINRLQVVAQEIQTELCNVINAPGTITPSPTSLNQVLSAINLLIDNAKPGIGTGSVAGVVKSSAAYNKVSIGVDGTMTPNALSDWTSSTSVKQAVEAASNAVSGETTAREAKDVASVANTTTSNTLTTTITSSDGTPHQSQGQAIVRSVDVDATTDTNTVKVSVNGVEDSDTVVKNVTATRSGDTVTIDVNGVQATFSVAAAAQDYKEIEQNTGRKWVNGDKVYSKTVIGKNKQITHDEVPFSKFAPDLNLSYPGDDSSLNWQAPYIMFNGKLYVGSGCIDNSDVGYVYCFDGTTWSQVYQTTYSVNCMIIYDGKLYVGVGYNSSSSGNGYVYCFDGTTWSQVSQIIYSVNYMIIFDGKLYVGVGYDYSSGGSGGYVYCFDGTTWSQVSQTTYSVHCMIIFDGKLYVGSGYRSSYGGNGYVYCFDGTTWTQVYQTTYSVNCMIIFDGKLYVGVGYRSSYGGSGYVYCFDGTTWTQVYQTTYSVNCMIIFDGKLYVGSGGTSSGGSVYCFDGTTWTQVYQTTGSWGIWHFAVYNDCLYAFPGGCAGYGSNIRHYGPWRTQDGVTWEDINESLFDLTMQYSSVALTWGAIPYTKVITYPDSDYEHTLTETHEQLWLFTSWYKGGSGEGARAVYKTMTDYITYTPNNHINTLPDFKHLVKCDRVVDDKPSEIEVSIDPATGNVDVGDPVRDYEHLDGVQLLLEYTKNEVSQ